jgi:FkbM family methyltransferase
MNLVRLLKNIPLRFNEERSDQIAQLHDDGWRRISLSTDAFIVCPDDPQVLSTWRFHAFSRGGRAELLNFLKLSAGCRSLLDIGASAGIFSALFANTRKNTSIHSVEPDGRSVTLLTETRSLNSGMSPTWEIHPYIITDRPGTRRFRTSGFGGEISLDDSDEEIVCHSLESLCRNFAVPPDLIKLDIEGFEFEAISGSLAWLKETQPRIFLELHWAMLEQRGHSPVELLQHLGQIGYRSMTGRDLRTLKTLPLDGSGVARVALVPTK